MKKEHPYGRNIFFIIMFILVIVGISFGNLYMNSDYDRLTASYIGAIMPLQMNDSTSITCERETKIDVHDNLFIKDKYTLNNNSSQSKKVKLYYPRYGNGLEERSNVVDIFLNNQLIDYRIITNGLYFGTDIELNESSQEYFNQIQSTHNQVLSKELEEYLNQKVYVYEFVNIRYPKVGNSRYIKIEYTNNPQIWEDRIVKTEDNNNQNKSYTIELNNEYYKRTPRLISTEKLENMKIIGYQNNDEESDPYISFEVKEYETNLKEAITLCFNDFVDESHYIETNIWDKSSLCQSYLKQKEKDFKETNSIDDLYLENILSNNIYYQYYNEIEIPAQSSTTIQYNYELNGTQVYNEEEKGLFHYMSNYLTDIEITKQKVILNLDDNHKIEDNDMGFVSSENNQEKEINGNQEKYFMKLKQK